MARGSYKIPFDPETGDLQQYPMSLRKSSGTWGSPDWRSWSIEPDWQENHTFEATLRIDGFERGRSAAHWRVFERGTERKLWVFMTDLMNVIEQVGIEKGGVVPLSTWTYCKRGTNFGVCLYG